METVVLRGIVTVNFELEIDTDEFAEICENNGLDPENINKFSKSDWLAIRSGLEAIVASDEQNIEYADIYEAGTISVDEASAQTDDGDIFSCYYNKDNSVHSIDKS